MSARLYWAYYVASQLRRFGRASHVAGYSLLLVAALPLNVQADPDWAQLTWENDLFVGEDDGYTNGLGFSWGHRSLTGARDQSLPDWIAFLASRTYIASLPQREYAVSYGVGQTMYTPDDIEAKQLIEDGRPYAGLLFWSGSLYAFDQQQADRLSLTLGVVGPAAGAKHSQKLVHSISGAKEPRGWSNQLHNEPVFALEAQRLWRLGQGNLGSLEWDGIGGGSAQIGNLASSVATGLTLRVGSRLASTWSGVSLVPARTINSFASDRLASWQLYLSVTGRYVANDITLDGNTFEDSHSVPLKHGQALASAGLAFNRGHWATSLSYQLGTDQYEGQYNETRFGSLSVTYLY